MNFVLGLITVAVVLVGCGPTEEEENEAKSELLAETVPLEFFQYKLNIDSAAVPEISCNQFMFEFVTNNTANCKAVNLDTEYISAEETKWTFTSPDKTVSIEAVEVGDGELIINEKSYFCWMFLSEKVVPAEPEDSFDYDFVTLTVVTEQNNITSAADIAKDKLALVSFSDGEDCKLTY